MAWLAKWIRLYDHNRRFLSRDTTTNGGASRLIPILWSCLVGFFSILPTRLINRSEFHGSVHAAAHVLAFCLTMTIFSARAKTIKLNILYAVWTLSLALISEWLEMVVFHSRFEWADIRLDFAGVAVGLLFVAIYATQRRAHPVAMDVMRAPEDGPPISPSSEYLKEPV